MDKKSWIVILACALLIFLWGPLVQRIWPPKPLPPETVTATNVVPTVTPPTSELRPSAATPSPEIPSDYEQAPTLARLENNYVTYEIVAPGSGIRQVLLKKHRAEDEERVALNPFGRGPILQTWGIVTNGAPDLSTGNLLMTSSNQVLLETELQPGLKLRKQITLTGDYTAKAEFTFLNITPDSIAVPNFYVNCGTASPIHQNDLPLYIGWDWFDGKKSDHEKITTFAKGGFLFFTFRQPRAVIEETRSLEWLSSRNQFFVTLLDPKDISFLGYRAEEVNLPRFKPQQSQIPKGAQIWGLLPGFSLTPAGEKIVTLDLYTGPREYRRLTKLDEQKKLIMDFGFWSWVSVPLLNTMNFLHRFVHNYGVAIILMVLLIKGIFWPLQSKANRTMKQMQVLGPKLKELQAKYKDQPQKIQMEMMQMYRNYGINPMGGCLPMLVQIPVFFGFYAMLQSAVELRDANFLWIKDLSQPDTVAHIFGFPFNPLPLVMGATSLWQTSIMPMGGMDKGQATIMKLMPLLFVIFCYNFSSALALYWTVQNLVGVYQTYHNLAKPAPELKKVDRPKGRWQAMMEMARQQAELQKQQKKQRKK